MSASFDDAVPAGKVSLDAASVQYLREALEHHLISYQTPSSVAAKIANNVPIRIICLESNIENAQNREFLNSMAEHSAQYVLQAAADVLLEADDAEIDDDEIADRVLSGMSIELQELTKDEAQEMEAAGETFTPLNDSEGNTAIADKIS